MEDRQSIDGADPVSADPSMPEETDSAIPAFHEGDMDVESECTALLGWVQSLEHMGSDGPVLSQTVRDVDDLCDGTAFFDVLTSIDDKHFKNPHRADGKENWILKIGRLKRLYKLIVQYYTEVLHQSPNALPVPNLDALARDSASQELSYLGRLVLGIAVRSDQANLHIEAIQTLDLEKQQRLMHSIEQVMEALKPMQDTGDEKTQQNNDNGLLGVNSEDSESPKYEGLYYELLKAHRNAQTSLDDANAERDEAVTELARFKDEVERNRNIQADVLMRQEIERLKSELRRSEDNLAEAEREVEKLQTSVHEFARRTDDLQKTADENAKLKDQVDELKHAADKLQKTENVMEKYKRKLEEGSEVRRQLKSLEAQNSELVDRNAALEDEYKRVAHFKPLMDSYKSRIAELETKNSTLHRDLNSARYETEQITTKLRATEDARTKEKEEMELYQERIQELELGGAIGKRQGTRAGDVNGAEGLAANNEEFSEDDAADENLEDALSGTTMTGLKIQVRKLSRELKVAQANKADAGRLLVVENLLQDANRMKSRYEKDYLREYQAALKLRKQLDAVQEGRSDLGDGPEANHALRLRLNESMVELDQVKKDLSELQVHHEETKYQLSLAKADLTLVDKDKLEMIESVRASVNVEKGEMERSLKQMQEDLDRKEEQIRMNVSQINSLLMDKVDLQNDSIEQRDHALQRELELGDWKPKMITQEAQDALQQKEHQVHVLQEKLHKARTFIKQQDKLIKDSHAGVPEEIQDRLGNLTRESSTLRQELSLMMSSWYTLSQQLFQRNIYGSPGAGASSALRAQTRAAAEIYGDKPKSWLLQQRSQLTGGISLVRK